MDMFSVTIVGVGRVGGGLALALPRDRYRIDALVYRNSRPPSLGDGTHAEFFTSIDDDREIDSKIIFVTTQDGEIEGTAELLADKIIGCPFVFHTSGALSSSVLDALKNVGCRTGSIHPLVSISQPELASERFNGSYFCVEGDAEAVSMAHQIVADLGGKAFAIDTKFKTLYHAAAVTACGHLVALFDASVEMMAKAGLSSEKAKEILMPLVLSTVQNLAEQPTSAALTGTFARADIETFTHHLTALNANVDEDLLEIYLLLGERSLELAARQGVSAERIETLRAKVSVAKSKLKW